MKSAYALIRVMWTDFASQVINHEGCVCVCVCVSVYVERETSKEKGAGDLVALQHWPLLSGTHLQVHGWPSLHAG